MPFHNVVSLGGWCQTAHQIHRRYGEQHSSVFDWLVTPFEGTMAVLDDAAERIAQSVTLCDEPHTVTCDAYGVQYHHDFERANGRIIPFGDDDVAAVRSELRHKWSKMTALVGETLFVRFGTTTEPLRPWPYDPASRAYTSADLAALTASLDRAFPRLPYKVLFIHHPGLMPALPCKKQP